MLLVGILEWWYGAGFRRQLRLLTFRIESIFDMFSVHSLVKTWLAPYKQISASLGQADNSFAIQIRHMFDNLISRLVGAIVRTFMIVVGLLAVGLLTVVNFIFLGFWLVVPFLPIISILLFVVGVKL